MTLADLVSELGAQMPLQVKRHDSVDMLRQAGVTLRGDRGGNMLVAPTSRVATAGQRLRAAAKRSA